MPLVLAAIAAILYASSGHIDKYLISKAVKNSNYRAIVLVSTMVSGGVMTIIYLFVCDFNLAFDWQSILMLLLNAILNAAALIFWFKAIDRDDVTIVTIMLQLIPVFVLLVAPIFLRDQDIGLVQLLGGGIVTFAALLVTYEPSRKKFNKSKLITLAIMTIVSFAYAVYDVIARYVNQSHDFNQTILWSNIMLLAVGLFMMVFIKSYRKSFREMFGMSGVKVVSLNLVNELFFAFGNVILMYAGTMAPVALVSFAVQGVQPFAVMLLGILITKMFPKIENEKTTKKEIVKRIISISICVIGLACIEFG